MKPGKASKNYWIKSELGRHFEDLNFEKGVDLNRNGRIRGSERTDLNGDGTVDVSELKRFLKANQPALKNLGGFFKAYYSHGQVFRPDNPIHNLLQIESEMVPLQMVEAAYQKVMQILNIVILPALVAISPEAKLKTFYQARAAVGIVIKNQDDGLFTHNINEGMGGVLDCDTSSFAVQAIAHELNWPVYLVNVPEHMFVRWDDGKYRFNMDGGHVWPDEFYQEAGNISSKSIKNGVYLKNLTSDETLAQYLAVRGLAKEGLGNLEGAIADYTEAIKLDPNYCLARNNRGTAKYNLGDLEDASADYTKVIELDPNNIAAYINRGLAKARLNNLEEAIADFTKAIKLDPDNLDVRPTSRHMKLNARYNRGIAKYKRGDMEGAVADFTEVIRRNPTHSGAYHNRGVANRELGRHKEAREDFQKAKELESKQK
jgi:tetratricopeptide (TPR) repeat protein